MSAWIPIAQSEPKIVPAQSPGRKPRRVLTEEEKQRVRDRAASGEPRAKLALEYDVSMTTINRLCEGVGRCGRQSKSSTENPVVKLAEAPVSAPECPRVKTPDYVRRRAVERVRELQDTIATKRKQKDKLEQELTAAKDEYAELQAWLEEN